MRISFLVYGALYVAVEIVGQQLEAVGWPEITPLDVATAVTDALLGVAVAVAVLVGMDLLRQRWRRSAEAWAEQRAQEDLEQPPLGVRSWRREPLALPAGSPAPLVPPGARPYGERSYAAHASADETCPDRSSGTLEGRLL